MDSEEQTYCLSSIKMLGESMAKHHSEGWLLKVATANTPIVSLSDPHTPIIDLIGCDPLCIELVIRHIRRMDEPFQFEDKLFVSDTDYGAIVTGSDRTYALMRSKEMLRRFSLLMMTFIEKKLV